MSNNLSYPNSGTSDSSNGGTVIRVNGISKSFDNGKISVLKDVSFDLRTGELVALWGTSGSGKSTLLHLLGGLDTAEHGVIEVAGYNPAKEKDRLVLRRRHVGFIFQLHNLLPDLTLRENCWIPGMATRTPNKQVNQRFEELAEWLGLGHRMEQRVRELSGGERQRTAICRALMHRPNIILADEPTGSLDEKNGVQVFKILQELVKREQVTVIMATHERHFAQQCDRHLLVRDGRIEHSSSAG